VVRDLVIQIELAKPAVGQVQLYFLTQLAFRADAIAVAHDEHPDHQLGVDRRAADLAVVGLKLLVQVGECRRHEHVHAAQQVVLGDAIFELELVEQTALVPLLPPHHRRAPAAANQSASGNTVRGLSQALFRQHRSGAPGDACLLAYQGARGPNGNAVVGLASFGRLPGGRLGSP